MINLRKLTFEDAQRMRECYLGEEHTKYVKKCANEYGVSQTTIRRILKNQTYLSVEQTFTNQWKKPKKKRA